LNRAFGDFQTPISLVHAVLECLSSSGKRWSRVLEPTCGRGNFIEGLLNLSTPPQEIQAIEVQDDYVLDARKWANHSTETRVIIKHANIFDLNFQKDLHLNKVIYLLT
jgi:hypothetical protein